MREALHQGKRFRIPVKNKTKKLKTKTYTKLYSLTFLCHLSGTRNIPLHPPSLLGRSVMLTNSRFKSVNEDSQLTVFSTLFGVDLFSLLYSLILLPELVLPQLSTAFPTMETDTFHILSGTAHFEP